MRMMNKLSRKVLKCQAGASLIFSLIVILILLALATTVLMVSVGNLRLASSSSQLNFSGSLQDLIGQYYLREVDYALEAAEIEAQSYFQNNYFSYTEADVTFNERAFSETMKTFLNSGHQPYIYEKWLKEINDPAIIKKVNVNGGVEDAKNYFLSTKYFEAFYKEMFPYIYYCIAYDKLMDLSQKVNDEKVLSDLRDYIEENSKIPGVPEEVINFQLNDFKINNPEDIASLLLEKRLNESKVQLIKRSLSDMRVSYKVDLGTGKTLSIEAKVIAPKTESIRQITKRTIYGNPIWGNAITANGVLTFNDQSDCAIDGDIFSGYMNNDKDSIIVKSNRLAIEGNVYAKGNFKVDQPQVKPTYTRAIDINKRAEKKRTAITQKMKIYDGSPYMIKLKNRNAFGYVKKDKDGLFKASVAEIFNTEDKIDKEREMPYVLDDSFGGNLYTRGIVVDPKVTSHNLTVNGSTFFFDDILNTGSSYSQIDLNGYVIGLDQLGIDVSTFGKDTAAHFEMEQSDDGSCIKNFRGDQGNTINIKSPMIFVPGNAILKDDNNKPYKTGTGVVDGTNQELYFKPYEVVSNIDVLSPETSALADRASVYNFGTARNLKLGEAEASKKLFIENNVYAEYGEISESLVESRIKIELTSSSKKSYIQGTSFFKRDNRNVVGNNYMHVMGRKTSYFNNDLDIYKNYMTLIDKNEGIQASEFKNMYVYEYIYRVFKSKTQCLGLWGISNIASLVNPNVVTNPTAYLDQANQVRAFYKVDELNKDVKNSAIKFVALRNVNRASANVVDLTNSEDGLSQSNEFKRLIYSDGDLKIINNSSVRKTIRGSVIANGNITIEGNVSIIYDESVIKELLESSHYAREFFQPGETGLEISSSKQEVISARGRKLEKGERVDLLQWRLSPVERK